MPGAAASAPRIIVEIPADQAFDAARKALLDAVDVDLTEVTMFTPDAPIQVRVVGYGFGTERTLPGRTRRRATTTGAQR
jgi:hypothetical protein